MNHAGTYVIDGASFGVTQDILLRTGNGLVRIKPEARAILAVSEESGFRVYNTEDLPPDIEAGIIEKLGLMEEYDLMEKFGPGPHFARMNAMRQTLEGLTNDN